MSTLQQAIACAHGVVGRTPGLAISPSRINKIVRRAWHANPEMTEADLVRCITYADPTGDRAVAKVMREAG